MGKIIKRGRLWPVLLLSGCILPMTSCVSDPYLAADRARWGSVGAEWINYVRHDATLTGEQRQLRELQYTEWNSEILAREARIVR